MLLTTLVFPASAAEEQYVGIGAMFDQPWKVSSAEQRGQRRFERDDTVSFVYISRLACNGPAEQAGLKSGDVVVAFEDTVLAGLTQDKLRNAMRIITNGAEGDPVTLTIKRMHKDAPDEQFDVEVVRQKVTHNFDCK